MLGAHVEVRTPEAICGGCLVPVLLDLAIWGVTDHTRPHTGHCHLAAASVPSVSVTTQHSPALEQGGTGGFSGDTWDLKVRARCCDS